MTKGIYPFVNPGNAVNSINAALLYLKVNLFSDPFLDTGPA